MVKMVFRFSMKLPVRGENRYRNLTKLLLETFSNAYLKIIKDSAQVFKRKFLEIKMIILYYIVDVKDY